MHPKTLKLDRAADREMEPWIPLGPYIPSVSPATDFKAVSSKKTFKKKYVFFFFALVELFFIISGEAKIGLLLALAIGVFLTASFCLKHKRLVYYLSLVVLSLYLSISLNVGLGAGLVLFFLVFLMGYGLKTMAKKLF